MFEDVNSSVKLSTHIHELEKAFKHNLFLLELKNKEIERVCILSKQLECALLSKSQEISNLNSKILNFQNKIEKISFDFDSKSRNFEIFIENLKDKIKGSNMSQEKLKNHFQMDLVNQKIRMKEDFEKIFNQRNLENRKILEKFNIFQEKTKNEITVLKNRIEELLAENNYLRTQNRQEKTDMTFKISVLDSELHNSKKEALKIQEKIDFFKNQNEIQKNQNLSLENEISKLRNEISGLKNSIFGLENQILTNDTKMASILKNIDDISDQNKIMKSQIMDYEKKNFEITSENEIFRKENFLLSSKIQNLQKSYCCVPEHSNLETLSHQNEIFKKIIKNLKSEKEKLEKQFNMDLENLEKAFDLLKQQFYGELTRNKDQSAKMDIPENEKLSNEKITLT